MIRKKQRLLPKVNNDRFDILGDGISCSTEFCNNNAPFSTFDNDNDGSPTANNAAKWRGPGGTTMVTCLTLMGSTEISTTERG